jgi:hypothetical protein
MKKKKLMLVLSMGACFALQSTAQQYNEAFFDSLIQAKTQSQVARTSKFMVTGDIASGITFTKDASSFFAGIAPIFLWKPADRLAVEAEFETELDGQSTMINLEYADVAYTINRYMTIRAGKFLSPFGIYQDRLHPEWINKLPSIPLGFSHDDAPVMPTFEIGVDLRGAIPLGTANLNYSVYVSNGPSLNTTGPDMASQGLLNYGSANDNNKNKAFGGRIGLLPFSNSSLELGVSGQFAKVGDQKSVYQNVGTQQYALDLIYGKQLDFLKGYLDIKGQWNWINVDNAAYTNPEDTTTGLLFTYKNQRNAGFGQVAYRPTMSQNKFLKKTELIFRYSEFNPPGGLPGMAKTTQYTYGLTYWYTWRTAFKLAWQSQTDANAFYIQVALGF